VDVSEVDDALAHLGCSADVLTLDPMTLDQVVDSVVTVGAATQTQARATEIVDDCRARLAAVDTALGGASARPTLVLEWTDPAFTAGHWVPDMVARAGGKCVLAQPGANSVGVDWPTITGCGAEVVLVAPCGFRLDGAADQAGPVMAAGVLPPGAEVWAVDADALVVRPGPRVVEGVELFASILHPDRMGPPAPATSRRLS
ncbi:MAG: cobalamin-binding protein, partial [Ilumatobacteraceae bacterium]